MAIEQEIAKLVQSSNDLSNVVSNKLQDIDQRVESAEADFQNAIGDLGLINLLPDSGRFGIGLDGSPTHLQLDDSAVFSRGRYFLSFNGSTAVENGKFHHNNATFGGSSSVELQENIKSLIEKARPAGDNRAFGTEFNIVQFTQGTGTSNPLEDTTHYLATTNQARQLPPSITALMWVRCISGSVRSLNSAYYDGRASGGQVLTPANGWVHFAIHHVSSIGFFSSFPFLYATHSAVFEVAMPAFVPGNRMGYVHSSPIPYAGGYPL